MTEKENENTVQRHLLSVADRSGLPRERALRHGIGSLSDVEIMAILLGTGTKGKNVIDLATEILMTHSGHLSELARMSVNELMRTYNGMGQSKALTLLAALELGRRAAADAAELQASRQPITSSSACYELLRHDLQHLTHEEFWILLLNNNLRLITHLRVSQGASTATIVEIKKIIKLAIDYDATAFAVFHNHPSGQLRPSVQDDALTRKIVEAAKIFDIRVIDHLIITSTGYYSYADSGRL